MSGFCPDPGLNQGPLDLQSNALPTELSRPVIQTTKLGEQVYIYNLGLWTIKGINIYIYIYIYIYYCDECYAYYYEQMAVFSYTWSAIIKLDIIK